ncbi:phage tail tip lysozyme [Methylobacterium sp. NFXW15]|uniref:phage tail tip lysozyme n=1 Tax=Methylobacterium sp. NFXW15 TaxID=2819512 RepID=UPI003CF727DD
MANSISPNALLLYNKFLELGISPGAAAGAVGSMIGESGEKLNPAALNPGDGRDGSDSIGMGQWNQGRATALRRTAQEMGTSWTDPRAQVAHIGNELNGSHRHVLKALLAAGDDVRAGNDIWTRQYEVPANAGAVARARLGDGIRFAGQIGAMSPEQMAAISSQVPAAPAEPATRGGRGGNSSTRDIVANSSFDLGPSPLAGMIALGGPSSTEPTQPSAQLASADRAQADALTARVLSGATPAVPAAPATPVQAAPAAAPVQTAGVIGSTPGSTGNPYAGIATPTAQAAPQQPALTQSESRNPYAGFATPSVIIAGQQNTATPSANAEYKFNDTAEAPANIRFEVDALPKYEDQLTALRKHYPTAQTYDGDNFIYQNDKGEWQKYNNKGWIPSLGDIAGAAPMLAEMIGGAAGAAGGGAIGNLPGALAGAATGGTAAREAAQRGINWYYGNTDSRTTGEQVQDAAITAAANAAGEGAGRLVAKGLGAAGGTLGFGKQATTDAVTDMRAIGLEPTVGMATANAPTQYLERAVSAVPVLGSRVTKAGEDAAARMAAENDRIVSGIASSTNPTAMPGTTQEVGNTLKQAAGEAEQRFFDAADQQYGNVSALTGNTPVQGSHIANLGRALANESSNITSFGRETHGAELASAMRRVRALGEDVVNGSTFDSIKEARTQVGRLQRASTNAAEQGYLGRMYDALTAEMGATADAAGNGARAAWQEADAAYRAGMAKGSPTNVRENLAPILSAKVEENVLGNLLTGSDKGGNKIAAARRQIVEEQGSEAWDQFTAAAVQRMGTTSDGFSASAFLKGWNTMSAEAKAALFDGTANEAYRADLDRLARIAAQMKRYGKSVNGSNTSNLETVKAGLAGIGAIGGAAATGKAALALGNIATGASTIAATKGADILLTSPRVVAAIANLPRAQVQRGGVQKTVADLLEYAASPGVPAAFRESVTELARKIENANVKDNKRK